MIASQITAIVASFENRKRTEVMSQSRIAKAKRGEAVSRLSVGWVKGPDGKYQFDPRCEGTIRMIIDTFFQTRSISRTVKALAKAGVQIPYRYGERIVFRRPNVCRVGRILTHPNYVGTLHLCTSPNRRWEGRCLPAAARNALSFPKIAGLKFSIIIQPT